MAKGRKPHIMTFRYFRPYSMAPVAMTASPSPVRYRPMSSRSPKVKIRQPRAVIRAQTRILNRKV